MLQVLIQTIFFFFIISQAGLFFCRVASLSFENPFQTLLTGVLGLAMVTRIAHFFTPIGVHFFLFFLILSLFYFIYDYCNQVEFLSGFFSVYSRPWILLLVIVLLVFSAYPSIDYDDGLYHAGFIRWINEYPLIKGLANVHERFGFNSNWHLLSALFNGFGIWSQNSNSISFYLVLLFLGFFLHAGKRNPVYFIATMFLLYPVQMVYQLLDPAADLIVVYFTLALICELLTDVNEIKGDGMIFWFLFLPFLITCKLNAGFTVVFAMLLFFKMHKVQIKKLQRHLPQLFMISVLLGMPWIISNWILSGYFVYPYLEAPFGVIWKVPRDWVIAEMNFIRLSPILNTIHLDMNMALQMTRFEIFERWIVRLRWVEKSVLLLFLSSSVLILFSEAHSKKSLWIRLGLLCILTVQIFFVPDIRFFAGTGFGIVAYMLYSLLNYIRWDTALRFVAPLLFMEVAIIFILYFHLIAKIIPYNGEKPSIGWLKKSPYRYDRYFIFRNNELKYYTPERSQFCWDSIPCSFEKNDGLRMIGSTMEDGFYQENVREFRK